MLVSVEWIEHKFNLSPVDVSYGLDQVRPEYLRAEHAEIPRIHDYSGEPIERIDLGREDTELFLVRLHDVPSIVEHAKHYHNMSAKERARVHGANP